MPKSDHHAYYDTEGNIIIPAAQEESLQSKESKAQQEEVRPRVSRQGHKKMTSVYAYIAKLLREGFTQAQSLIPRKPTIERPRISPKKMHTVVWAFLCQPVWVPGKNRQPRQYSRVTLFLLDTARFGSTFAVIFGILFLTLNFESFWDISTAYIDPLRDIKGQHAAQELKNTLSDKLKKAPALAVAGRGNLLSILPAVGPPDNRLIIPSLNLNVPIEIPPNNALLGEDWDQLEVDIQKSLEDGVVHYPGTARPGQAGNFFVTGHSSYYPWAEGDYKSVFARLPELNVGDEYWVYYGGDRHRYIIKEKREVRPTNVSVLDQPLDERMSTLMTCTPVGTTLRRLVLRAKEVDPVTGEILDIGERSEEEIVTPRPKMELLPI
jgi:LPXTG-site transpeptidase (sortase) family protein